MVEIYLFFPADPPVFLLMWGTVLVFVLLWLYKFVVSLGTGASGS